MTTVALTDLGTEIERRLTAYVARFEPDSPRMREALLRSAFLIEAETKLNIRRKGIIDTGRLLNSIRHEFYKESGNVHGVRVGSFGVPYAAIHEFGGPFTDSQRRAMFASLRDKGKIGPSPRPSKGVVIGRSFRSRPYLRPALAKHADRIAKIIRGVFK